MSEFIYAMRKWPEKADFCIDRPSGNGYYTFVQFHSKVDIFYGGKWQQAIPGSLIMYAPSSKQLWKCTGQALLHDWFHADERIKPIFEKYGFKTDTIYFTSSTEEISKIVGHLEYNQFSDCEFKDDYTCCLLHQLFITIKRGASQKNITNIDSELKSRLRGIRNEMFLNLAEPHSVPSLAKKAAMSESHFYAVYKKLFGVSPAKDLSAARIERAKVLLREGKSVSAVAIEVGFSSEYQFIRSFSKAVGLTPGAYKKQY